MHSQPPEELKIIRPHIQRGNQMAKVDSVITYYCYYWALKQSLDRKLHNASPECGNYVMEIMQDLEERKQIFGDNELITDDLAAQAYVENFSLKVFNNGFGAVEARKATRATADALQAASVFLELVKIFTDNLEPEISKKIKYAKFHAARILKALREGIDPNPPLTPPETNQNPPAPSLEDVPDEYYGETSTLTSITPQETAPDHTTGGIPPPVTKIQSSTDPTTALASSHTQNLPYSSTPPNIESFFPSAPSSEQPLPSTFPRSMSPTTSPFQVVTRADIPTSSLSFPTEETLQQPLILPNPPEITSDSNPLNEENLREQTSELQSNRMSFKNSQVYHDPRTSMLCIPSTSTIRKPVSPEDIAKAQKFAKWAISALDYDDIENAIEQFQNGLAALGVS